jgi:hypothetical protein
MAMIICGKSALPGVPTRSPIHILSELADLKSQLWRFGGTTRLSRAVTTPDVRSSPPNTSTSYPSSHLILYQVF